jgi:predicted secreted protein
MLGEAGRGLNRPSAPTQAPVRFAAMLTNAKSACTILIAAVLIALSPPSGINPALAQVPMQANQTVSLSPGTSTTIVLSENPTTGYKWRIDSGQSSNLAIVQVTDGGYQAAQTGLMGAGGSHRWQIEARAAGTARLVFAYARSWEHKAPAKTYVVEVDVTHGP